jgi:hypothetical protein
MRCVQLSHLGAKPFIYRECASKNATHQTLINCLKWLYTLQWYIESLHTCVVTQALLATALAWCDDAQGNGLTH